MKIKGVREELVEARRKIAQESAKQSGWDFDIESNGLTWGVCNLTTMNIPNNPCKEIIISNP